MKTCKRFLKLNVLICSALLICAISIAQDPDQYGTPFTGVPDAQDAVIYQVNMRCFSSTRNFQGVIDRLDNIKALGVNVIYLMPFYPVGTLKAFNSPYCIKDLYSVAAEFGTLTDLRNLVDEAHAKGMAVMIDWVSNQTSWDHPWINDHKDWYLQDKDGNIIQLNTYSDVAALNFSNTSMRAEMINAMRYWVFTANIDGFRCDFADNPPINYWQEAITSLRGITSHTLLLLAEGSRSANYTAGFDYNFGFQFYYNSIIPIYKNSSTVMLINNSNTQEYTSASDTQQVARYLSNHDIYGSEGSPYTIFNGKEGTLAAFVVTALMKSVPFIYNGMEVGNTVAMPFPFTSSVIDWTEDESITPEMTKIIAIRNNNVAIRRGSLTSYTNSDVCAFRKVSGTDAAFVLSNLRNAEKTFTLPSGIANTSMVDELSNTDVNLGSTISLAAYEYKVFTTDNFVSVNEMESLSATTPIVYPNPCQDGLVIIKIPGSFSDAMMNVFDLQGKQVLSKQIDSNPFSISNLSKGIYFVKLVCSDNVMITKFVKE
jgi:glycosidase